MTIEKTVSERLEQLVQFRRDLHQHPELQYELPETSRKVADALREAGVDEIHEGLGQTGVVGLIHGAKGASGPSIGLRADMDALPIHETTGKPWASRNPGKMHACGHDGHTAMLMGAAMGLVQTRDFDGTAVLIFQPAEEGGAGARAMMEDGLFQRFPVTEVYGMHNKPGLPVGEFRMAPGPVMGSVDQFEIEIAGVGGHAAMPEKARDPLPAMAALLQALQTIVSRSVDPIERAVVSVTTVHGGDAFNVIPPKVTLTGTVRTLNEAVRDVIEARMRELTEGIASAHGVSGKLDYDRRYPVTINHAEQVAHAAVAAEAVAGPERVHRDMPPTMGGEDFSFMLNAVPGAYINIGNGTTAGIHHPDYDFNDEALGWGASYWMSLVRNRLPL